MFQLFKPNRRMFLPLSEYAESWSLLKGGNNLIVRVNVGYKDAIGHPGYPISMGVAVPYNLEHDETIQATKNAIEDAINGLLSNGQNGTVVAIITSTGERKFYEILCYTKNKLDFASIHQILKEKFSGENIQMHATPDPGWEKYKVFVR